MAPGKVQPILLPQPAHRNRGEAVAEVDGLGAGVEEHAGCVDCILAPRAIAYLITLTGRESVKSQPQLLRKFRISDRQSADAGGETAQVPSLKTCMRLCTRDPDGRVVVFDAGSQLHLALRRPWLLDHLDAIMTTISEPDRREADPRPARERFYRQHLDLKRWMRVVVDFGEDPAWVVTVTIQNHSPMESR